MPSEQTPPRPAHRISSALLDDITAGSLDVDYAHAARRRRTDTEEPERRTRAAAIAVLAAFGLLVATAAVQTSRNASDRDSSRSSIITQIQARSAAVDARRSRISNLRREVEELQTLQLETTAAGRSLSARLDRLGLLTGSTPATGPGVRVVVDDAPGAVSDQQRVLAEDLYRLVNALWAAGAEAISVNGQRVTALTAIRFAGSAITINNSVSLSAPYTVLAIGNPDTMPARFVETTHGTDWLDLRALYGLQFEMTSARSLRIPAARRLNLRHATVGEGP
jgi:uncharacterized protein YlxW (UPF0749 family)